jgi:multimeric flavodoxin WrbA
VSDSTDTDEIDVRKGQGSVALTREEFRARFLLRFFDPAFVGARDEVERVCALAWEAYDEYRKAPRTRRAGEGFADPDYELSIEWIAARAAIHEAQRVQEDSGSRSRVLLISGGARSDQTCPGEMSKTFRLVTLARQLIEREPGFEVDLLDLSKLTAEYGRTIHPCKGCVSTAMPLCHWPCSCYPNHALGQSPDWMNELYPRWIGAHGVMIVTPVYWYQAPSVLKLMIDRLVCADGGNPDPSTTHGKDAAAAKALELAGWHYPRHLAGRAFSVVVHGDAAGTENLRRMLTDWLTDMHLIPAAPSALLDRYVGYFEPYATSHAALDADEAFQEEVRNAARALVASVRRIRTGEKSADASLSAPRPK